MVSHLPDVCGVALNILAVGFSVGDVVGDVEGLSVGSTVGDVVVSQHPEASASWVAGAAERDDGVAVEGVECPLSYGGWRGGRSALLIRDPRCLSGPSAVGPMWKGSPHRANT